MKGWREEVYICIQINTHSNITNRYKYKFMNYIYIILCYARQMQIKTAK